MAGKGTRGVTTQGVAGQLSLSPSVHGYHAPIMVGIFVIVGFLCQKFEYHLVGTQHTQPPNNTPN